MKISLLQSGLRWQAPEINMRSFAEALDRAPQADLYLLPEMFTTGFAMEPEGIADGGEAALGWMKEQARRKGAAVAGSVAVEDGGRYFNRFYFVTPEGGHYAYDKRHLFSMGGERGHYTAGEEKVAIEYKGWRILLLVCYDLRFPVWSRSAGDVDLILCVANWPTPRVGAWDTLLKARAIENQCYVAGCNRVGGDPDNDYCGHSVVVDYLGNVIAEGGEGAEAVISAEISIDGLNAFRDKFPAWKDADKFTING